MATVKDSDTNLWLHNKLGDSEDLWSGISSVGSQLKGDLLKNVFVCFQGLHPTVKLKVLMAILHMPRRNVEEFQQELNAIIHLARDDSDQWVGIIGDILHTYPSTGSLNLDIEDDHSFVKEVLYDLRKHLSETDSNSLLPLECRYLNKNALNQLVGMQAPPIKHFTLKRKPKSAALRADLLQKSMEAALQNKKQAGSSTVPTKNRMRKMEDSAPLKGIPKSTTGFRAAPALPRTIPLNRRMAFNREGGTKLLDITEQPLGGGSNREAKKRKKQAELEAQEQAKKDKEIAQAATPDYAAAFMSPASVKPAPLTKPLEEPAVPTYAPAVASSLTNPANITQAPSSLLKNFDQPATPGLSTKAARDNLQHQLQQSLEQSSFNLQNPTPTPAPATPTIPTTPTPATPTPITPAPTTPTPVAATFPKAVVLPTVGGASSSGAATVGGAPIVDAPMTVTLPQPAPTMTSGLGSQKKNLSLTKEQMVAAQDMFRQSKLSRPEKALIIGFMAGARDNPCPQQGDIITIRLSENREMVQRGGMGPADEMLVDTYFEMNYATGKWKRYKKYKPL